MGWTFWPTRPSARRPVQPAQSSGLVSLDDERKAAMVSNLLVVLCSDHDATPVVNTGTLYN
jgi:hypothetical protein